MKITFSSEVHFLKSQGWNKILSALIPEVSKTLQYQKFTSRFGPSMLRMLRLAWFALHVPKPALLCRKIFHKKTVSSNFDYTLAYTENYQLQYTASVLKLSNFRNNKKSRCCLWNKYIISFHSTIVNMEIVHAEIRYHFWKIFWKK
jgi:hypothetical protein